MSTEGRTARLKGRSEVRPDRLNPIWRGWFHGPVTPPFAFSVLSVQKAPLSGPPSRVALPLAIKHSRRSEVQAGLPLLPPPASSVRSPKWLLPNFRGKPRGRLRVEEVPAAAMSIHGVTAGCDLLTTHVNLLTERLSVSCRSTLRPRTVFAALRLILS